MKRCTSINEARLERFLLKGTVGFVPTMGALHKGHIALIDEAKQRCDHVIASIFVNPKQFGANEDLSHYPRPLAQDLALLEAHHVDMVFTPTPAELYPEGFATTVNIADLGNVLCGAHRSGHFAGVATVVTLLFATIRPTVAFFGEKDFQQLTILKRLNKDLRLIDEVIGIATVREADGLALSSRNQYLTTQQREIAPMLYQVMKRVVEELQAGMALHDALRNGTERLILAGFASIDYLEVRDAQTLALTHDLSNARLFAAAQLGKTRLIDNVSLATP